MMPKRFGMCERRTSVTGVVLIGGRSSRMGQNKATLDFHGRPLIAHMLALLKKAGIAKPLISGSLQGYDCLPDTMPFQGPAIAMAAIMTGNPAPEGYLFVPVDMPLLNAELLQCLLQQPGGSYYQDHPLPAFFVPPYRFGAVTSVRALLALHAIQPIPLAEGSAPYMKNFNTPHEWQGLSQS